MFIEGYIFFHDTPKKSWKEWWRLFTCDGFRHCDMVIRTGIKPWDDDWELWNWVDADYNCHMIQTVVANSFNELLTGMDKPNKVIKFKTEIPDRILVRVGYSSCVSFIKQTLGRRWRFVLTPKQLYKRLLKEGFPEI